MGVHGATFKKCWFQSEYVWNVPVRVHNKKQQFQQFQTISKQFQTIKKTETDLSTQYPYMYTLALLWLGFVQITYFFIHISWFRRFNFNPLIPIKKCQCIWSSREAIGGRALAALGCATMVLQWHLLASNETNLKFPDWPQGSEINSNEKHFTSDLQIKKNIQRHI
jgi:hypothetical protein